MPPCVHKINHTGNTSIFRPNNTLIMKGFLTGFRRDCRQRAVPDCNNPRGCAVYTEYHSEKLRYCL